MTRAGASRRARVEAWAFTLPALALQLAWGWYPLVVAFGLSFTSARIRGPSEFTGVDAYVRVLSDPLVAQAFRVTVVYAALSLALGFGLPVLAAILLLEMPERVLRWMLLLWFLPLSSIAGAALWRYAYNRDYGVMQWAFTSVGLPRQDFLASADQVLFWLVFPNVVLFGPGLAYVATLRNVPASFYEAAELEGARFWRKVRTISLPRLRPVIAMMLTFSIIGAFQAFDWPFLLTGGAPGGASRTVVMYVVELMRNLRYADATALAVLLFAAIALAVVAQHRAFDGDPDR